MSGHFIWDAIVTLGIITIVISVIAGLTWWGTREALLIAKRLAYPYLGRWARRQREKIRTWRRNRTRRH